MNETISNFRNLTEEEIDILKKQGCLAENWNAIYISPKLDITKLIHVFFKDELYIHEGVKLRNIPGGIGGCVVNKDAIIENVASIEFDYESTHAVGTLVSVLDETGSRAVPIFPGLSSQLAVIMARKPEWLHKISEKSLGEFLKSKLTPSELGEKCVIKNCGTLRNVFIDREVVVEGASRLLNGSIINNAEQGKCFSYIGNEVEAENFILEDGKLESKCHIVNCYIGQGAEIGSGFSAHDSLFFANCSFENGEAHSLLAGPFTVSMHKGTLLIGCQTSFMNAGSSSNQSNHMYKLGPLHWGILERGTKTSSASYLMHGAKIGAYSLLMGAHKTHPDSSDFPFSYLFGDERGNTVVVPGLMLRSCGLLRDEAKWPLRDRRKDKGLPLLDHITFNVFNPYTIDIMLKSIDVIDKLLSRPIGDESFIRYKGMQLTRAGIERARHLYTLAIFKYLATTLPELKFPENDGLSADEWVDLGGEILPRSYLNRIKESGKIDEAIEALDEAYTNYHKLELEWIGRRFDSSWRDKENEIAENARRLDEIIEEDRQQYYEMLEREKNMLSL